MTTEKNPTEVKAVVIALGSIRQRHVRNLRRLLGPNLDLIATRTRGLNNIISETMNSRQCRSLDKEYGVGTFENIDDALGERPTITTMPIEV